MYVILYMVTFSPDREVMRYEEYGVKEMVWALLSKDTVCFCPMTLEKGRVTCISSRVFNPTYIFNVSSDFWRGFSFAIFNIF